MDDKEKIRFFNEWIDEINDRIKKLEDEIAEMSLPNNRELWKLDQKYKIYNSDEKFKNFFSEEMLYMDDVKEEIEEEKPFKIEELSIYRLLKTKVEEKLNEYQQT